MKEEGHEMVLLFSVALTLNLKILSNSPDFKC